MNIEYMNIECMIIECMNMNMNMNIQWIFQVACSPCELRDNCDILFAQNECRKFRVKFTQGSFPSTLEACADCVAQLQMFLKVQHEAVAPSQVI